MFRRDISLPFAGSASKQSNKPIKAGGKLIAALVDFFVGLVFNLGDGGDMFFRNVR
jgi:hypothetical protein